MEDWGLDVINVPFSICHPFGGCISSQSPFDHSRCFNRDTKGADGAADLLEVLRNSPLEKLNFYDCSQIPSSAWQKLRGASWTNLREVNFRGCLVLQTWLRCLASSFRRRVYFPLLRAIVTAVSLTTFDNIERPKMWNRQLQKSLAKRSGNTLPSFCPHSPLLRTPGALAMTPKVPMGLQTCWKSCATLPWRSWTLRIALKFRPLCASEFPVACGPRCAMHTASPSCTCAASVASRVCFRCRGWMRRLRRRKRWWWNCCAQPVSVCLYLSLLLTGTVRWFSSCLYINVAFVHALASRQAAWNPTGNPEVFLREYAALHSNSSYLDRSA